MTGPVLRLGLLATHPIQYHVPWYRALAATPSLDLTVYYCMLPDPRQQGVGFDVDFQWDIPVLDGYNYRLLPNAARQPRLGTLRGCDTPSIHEVLARDALDAFIISGWGAKSYLQALWACRRCGIPAVVRGDSNALKPRPWYLRLAHRLLLSQYSAFLAVGQANAAFYTGHGVPPERIFPGPHCVDNARFQAAARRLEPQRDALRAFWRMPLDACVFLYCGKFVEKKRPGDLLRALGLMTREPGRPSVHLLMVGEGPLRAECERFAAEQALPVSFAGFLNQGDIPKAYVAADCLVLPSDYGETWGLVVNEAMACGRPAIVSDRVGCQPDLVVPGRTGAVVPFGSVRALANALSEFSLAPAQLRDMGAAAQHHLASYNVDRLVSGTLKALRFVTAKQEPTIMSPQ